MSKRTFIDKVISSKSSTENLLAKLLIVAGVAVILVFSIAFLPAFFHSLEPSNFGTFGDFVGGILNPILSFITILALIFTIILQQRELSLARKEFRRTAAAIERENFEATVFRLSAQIREDVNAIDILYQKGSVTGTDAFKAFYELVKEEYENESSETKGDHCASYNAIYDKHGHDFGHYYRLLYFTFRHIKKTKDLWDARRAEEQGNLDVDFYTKLIRAQISDYERLVFFYNFLSGRSENLTDLIEEYALFDNLDIKRLLSQDHISLISEAARGIRE